MNETDNSRPAGPGAGAQASAGAPASAGAQTSQPQEAAATARGNEAARKPLTPAAERALAEAAARRAEIDRKTAARPTELQGRGGLEPSRYGDWEVKGIASDF